MNARSLATSNREAFTSELVAAQELDDPNSVMLPNACKGCVITLKGGTRVRCFSTFIRDPPVMDESKWHLIQSPEDMPAPEGVEDVCSRAILVDHITGGLIGHNRMQMSMDDEGRLAAIRMYPPPGVDDADAYWEERAGSLHQASANARSARQSCKASSLIQS